MIVGNRFNENLIAGDTVKLFTTAKYIPENLSLTVKVEVRVKIVSKFNYVRMGVVMDTDFNRNCENGRISYLLRLQTGKSATFTSCGTGIFYYVGYKYTIMEYKGWISNGSNFGFIYNGLENDSTTLPRKLIIGSTKIWPLIISIIVPPILILFFFLICRPRDMNKVRNSV